MIGERTNLSEIIATKPLSVGDLIGRSVRYYRVHLPLCVRVLMWPTIAIIVGKVPMQWCLTVISQRQWEMMPLALGSGLLGLAIFVVANFIIMFRTLALVRLCNGFANTYDEAYQAVRRQIGKLLLLCLIGYISFFTVLIFCGTVMGVSAIMLKPGSPLLYVMFFVMTLGFLGLIATCLVFYLLWPIVMSLAACEERDVGTLISRALSLTFRDFGRATLFGALLLITYTALSYTLSLPAMVISLFEVLRHGITASAADPTKMPLYVLILTQSWESVVNMLLIPISWLAFGQFYYDLRVRQEGIDVLQNLKLLEQPSSP
jgi:hypothetical protein